MPVINKIADFFEEMKGWRRHLHANPELEFDCFKTSSFVIERLKEFGVDEIHDGIAKTGIVGIINGKKNGNKQKFLKQKKKKTKKKTTKMTKMKTTRQKKKIES